MENKYLILFLLFACGHQMLFGQIVNIEERRIHGAADSVYWYGSLRLGANVSKVVDQIFRFNTTGHVQYKKGRSRTLMLLDGNFLRAGKKDFNETAFAHLRFNLQIKEPIEWEAFVQTQYNKLLLIELRSLIGSGLRFRLLKDQSQKNVAYLGLAYLFEYNQFLEGFGDSDLHRLSTYVSFSLHPWEGVKLVNTTYYQPAFNDFNNYRLATEWRLDTPLGKKLTFFTDLTFKADYSLPTGVPRNTYAWLNGLAFKF